MVHKAVSTLLLLLLFTLFPFIQNVYLPEEKNCPIGFLHQITSGTKDVFWSYQVSAMKVPQWPEFSIAKMWD